jgi:hypothetical protein
VRADAGAIGLRTALLHLGEIREIATLCAGIHEVLGGLRLLRRRDVEPPCFAGPRGLVHYVLRTNRSLLATQARRSVGHGGPRSIVVVHDSDDAREVIEIILTEAGYRVVTTGDPRRALELVRKSRPDLVLCDIAMPGIDGHEVVRALQADAITARFPVCS